MLGYTPPQPRFWKALLASAPFVVVVAWSLSFFHLHIPTRILTVGAAIAWVVMAATIHARVSNDWRAEYELNLETQSRQTSVAPNVRVDRE